MSEAYRVVRQGLALAVLLLAKPVQAEPPPVLRYLVVEAAAEPLQITAPGEPLLGGLVTDVVRRLAVDVRAELQPQLLSAKRLEEAKGAPLPGWWLMYGWVHASSPSDGGECLHTPLAPWRTMLYTQTATAVPAPLSVEWLLRQRLLLVLGFQYPGLDEHLPPDGAVNVQRAVSPLRALQMLQRSRGDAVVELQLRARYWLSQLPNTPALVETPMDTVVPPDQLCLRVQRQMPAALKTRLEQALARLEANGDLARLAARYR